MLGSGYRALRRSRAAIAAVVGVVLVPAVAACGGSGPWKVEGTGTTPQGGTAASVKADYATPGSQGLGDSYFAMAGNGGYDVIRYRINNRIDFKPARLTTGTTTIVATATQDLSRFNLDFSLAVDRVRVDGVPARFARAGHELVITPATRVAKRKTFTTRVTYHSNSRPSGWFTSAREILATGEPEVAQWWFPSNDSPIDAATYDVKLDVPRGRQGVSVGRLAGQSTKRGRTVWHWRTSEPMATYVAFFAAGDFDMATERINGVRYTYAVSAALSASARATNMAMLKQTPAMLAALAKDYGRYPYADGGGLVTSTFRTEDWAMENQTRPTYPAMKDDDAGRRLMVHELGHQWFGDHVRPRRWRDIVNNEGFARWSEMRWSELERGIAANTALESMYADHRAGAGFWAIPIDDPGRGRMFSSPVYDRGGMMVQALRNKLGDRTFFSLLRLWTRRHGGKTARVADFEALAASVSGRDLDHFFRVWLRQPRRPAHTAANGFLVP